MFAFTKGHHSVQATAFSNFIRGASSGEKKRVYQKVLGKATERQNKLLEQTGRATDR